jgi:hypothetical protein
MWHNKKLFENEEFVFKNEDILLKMRGEKPLT